MKEIMLCSLLPKIKTFKKTTVDRSESHQHIDEMAWENCRMRREGLDRILRKVSIYVWVEKEELKTGNEEWPERWKKLRVHNIKNQGEFSTQQ